MTRSWQLRATLPITAALAMLAAACGSSGGGGAATSAPSASEAPASTEAGATTAAPAGTGETTTLPPTPGKGSAGAVTVFGVEDSENEAGAMQDALKEFGDANGIDITYVGR